MTEESARDGTTGAPKSALEVSEQLALRRLWRPVLGLALGALLLAFAARGIHLREVWRGMEDAEPLGVGLGLLTVLLTTAAKVGRWRGLFRGSEALRWPSLARALMVGQLVNALLPARLGEVARLYTLGRDEGVSRATVLGTIAAEKAVDVLFLLITAGLTAATASLPPWLHRALAGLAVLGAAILLTAIALPQRRLVAAVARVVSWLPGHLARRVTQTVERGLIGLEGLRHPLPAALACGWSIVIWSLAAGTNLVLFRAFHLSLSVGAALLLLTLLHVGTAPPSSPARLGVFHAITVVALGTFGVDRAASLAYAAVLHAIVYGPQVLLGALALGLRPPTRGAA